MLNSARKGLSYAAMLVMLASAACEAGAPTVESSWQKSHPRRMQLSARLAKQKSNRLIAS
jgi:hypothetical protein